MTARGHHANLAERIQGVLAAPQFFLREEIQTLADAAGWHAEGLEAEVEGLQQELDDATDRLDSFNDLLNALEALDWSRVGSERTPDPVPGQLPLFEVA